MTKINLTLEDLFRHGTQAHQLGNLSEAEGCYKKLLAVQRNHFDALHPLGVTRLQRGQYAEAERLIRQAIDFNPRFAPAWLNHGICLATLRRLDDVLAA